jgi:hypothetical protein
MEEEAEKPVSPGTTHNSQGRRSADSGASRLPEGYYRINALLDHLPAKARRENVKWYKVRWEEDRQVEWVAAEDVSEAAIEVYWENVTTRRIKRKGSKYELK